MPGATRQRCRRMERSAFSYTETSLARPGPVSAAGSASCRSPRSQFADTTVVAPAGRIDHRSAADLEAALSPLAGRGRPRAGCAGARLLRRRLHQQRRPARADDRRQADARARRRRFAWPRCRAWWPRSSPSAASTACWSCMPTLDDALAQALRRGAGRLPRGRPAAHRHEARALLGHARLAAGGADRGRRAAQAARRCCARARGRPLRQRRRHRALLRRPALRAGRHLRRPQLLRADRHRRARLPASATWAAACARSARRRWRSAAARPQTFHIFMSHLHWDHIMGLPFFVPAFIPGNRVVIYGSHRELEAALAPPAGAAVVPGRLRPIFGAAIEFVHLEPGVPHEVAGVERDDRCCSGTPAIPTATASSRRARRWSTRPTPSTRWPRPAHTDRFVDFFRDADLVIFDAMYSLADSISVKADWGHSSNVVGVELCQLAGARHLCLFHHEPVFDDEAIEAVLAETRRLEEITRGDAAAARQRRLRRAGNRPVTQRPAARAGARRGRGRIRADRRARCWSRWSALTWLQAPWTERLQAAWFDAHQALAPRQVRSLPVTVVEIDQKSLVGARPMALAAQPAGAAGRRSQPRREPAAIGVNILMPEADALSPERLLARARRRWTPRWPRRCARCPRNDADAGARAGRRAGGAGGGRHARADRHAAARGAGHGAQRAGGRRAAAAAVARYAGRADQHRRARPRGRGLGPDLGRSVARRDPPHPAGGQHRRHAGADAGRRDAARGACSAPSLRLAAVGHACRRRVGRRARRCRPRPTARCASYFSPRRADRFVSAVDVLEGRVDPAPMRAASWC